MIDSPHGRVTSYGGTVAAPIFKRIAEASLRHLGIAPTVNAPPPIMVARDTGVLRGDDQAVLERVAVRNGIVPDVRGLSARDAVRAFMRAGLSPRLDGNGFVVEQSPAAGTTLLPGDAALLKLQRRMTPPAGGASQ
jgi:cell division protein FtsI (penicillin-binding protein 3)